MKPADKARWRQRRQTERRPKVLQRLGGECEECGTTETLVAHHVDPESKRIHLSGVELCDSSWETIEAEMEKCILLCRACHTKHHLTKYEECQVKNCSRAHKSKGLCDMHYKRVWRGSVSREELGVV